MTVVAELIGPDEEGPFLAYVRRNHPTLFPLLPERTRYTRRRRVIEVIACAWPCCAAWCGAWTRMSARCA